MSDPGPEPKDPRRLVGLVLFLVPFVAGALDFPPLKPPASMFRAHRDRFLARLPPNSIAVLRAAPERTMSNDVAYLYRQDSDFWYLSGVEDPEAILIIRPNPSDGKQFIVFVRPRNPRAESYGGPRIGPQEAASAYGADAAFSTEEFRNLMTRYEPVSRTFSGFLAGVEKVYVSDGGDAEWASGLRESIAFMRARDAGPSTVVDAREVIHEMRVVKDADEIALVRRATEISGRGHVLAMKAVAPGKYEFEVQQALDGYCSENGVRRMAYPSIVASGPNSVFLHWDANDREIRDGDVDRIVREDGQRVFTKHGISHWVGLDVHDAGRYSVGSSSRPLEPGMVFTVEPGIYIPANVPGVDRKWWNIGVRIEDVVLVTKDGYECLSCFIPREPDDVEKTVQSGNGKP